jgi:hypothetical protein
VAKSFAYNLEQGERMSYSNKRRIAKLEDKIPASTINEEEWQKEWALIWKYMKRIGSTKCPGPDHRPYVGNPPVTPEELIEFEIWSEIFFDPELPYILPPTTPEDHARYAPLVKERLKTRGAEFRLDLSLLSD